MCKLLIHVCAHVHTQPFVLFNTPEVLLNFLTLYYMQIINFMFLMFMPLASFFLIFCSDWNLEWCSVTVMVAGICVSSFYVFIIDLKNVNDFFVLITLLALISFTSRLSFILRQYLGKCKIFSYSGNSEGIVFS